jgi:hypothetical protein
MDADSVRPAASGTRRKPHRLTMKLVAGLIPTRRGLASITPRDLLAASPTSAPVTLPHTCTDLRAWR